MHQNKTSVTVNLEQERKEILNATEFNACTKDIATKKKQAHSQRHLM